MLDYKKIEDEEYMAKRIIAKIMRERRNKRKDFKAEDLKQDFAQNLSTNEEVSEYQRRITVSGVDDSQRKILDNTGADKRPYPSKMGLLQD